MNTLEIFAEAKKTYLGEVANQISQEVEDEKEQGALLMGLCTSVDTFERVFCDTYLKSFPNGERGFELIKGFDGTLPTRATKHSAGYDIYSAQDVIIYPHQTFVIPTGVKAHFPHDEVLMIYVRSSVGIKRNLMLANSVGVIDSDYYNNPDNEGHIFVALYNFGEQKQVINKGDRIAQGVFHKFFDCGENVTIERVGGVGSTDV